MKVDLHPNAMQSGRGLVVMTPHLQTIFSFTEAIPGSNPGVLINILDDFAPLTTSYAPAFQCAMSPSFIS